MNDSSAIEYSCKDRIATIAFNRPEKLNAIDDDFIRELIQTLRRFDSDQDADVAVLCGNGRAFSSGADVQKRQLRSREEFLRMGGMSTDEIDPYQMLVRSKQWKPVIAAVHGYALGMALVLSLKCEFLIAAEGTRFQCTETPRGLSGAIIWALLHDKGAEAFATDVTLTGRFFTAEEAYAAGAIYSVTPAGQHREVAYALAAKIAANPPLGVRSAVRVRRFHIEALQRGVLSHVEPLKLHLTNDFQEAAQAFSQKRKAGPFRGE